MENEELIFCTSCETELARSMFYTRHERIIYPCKSCKKAYYIKWKERNKDYHKHWQADNKDRCRAYNVKHRASKKRPSA